MIDGCRKAQCTMGSVTSVQVVLGYLRHLQSMRQRVSKAVGSLASLSDELLPGSVN